MPYIGSRTILQYETSKIGSATFLDSEVWIVVGKGAVFSSHFVDEYGRRWILSAVEHDPVFQVCYRPETRR